MNPIDAFRVHFEEFKIFDETSYNKSFDYEELDAGFEDLNFVYLCSKTTLRHFKKSVGIHEHGFEEGTAATSPFSFTGDDILDTTLEIARSGLPAYKTLEFAVLEDISEDELVFMNEKCFKLIKSTFKNLKDIKRVLHKTAEGLKVELYPPRVRVLMLDNSAVVEMRFQELDSYIIKTAVSKYMNGSDLKNYLLNIAMNIGYKRVSDNKTLLPDIDELGPVEMMNISSGKLKIVPINKSSLLKYEIYNNKVIIFYFKSPLDNWKINFGENKPGSIELNLFGGNNSNLSASGRYVDRQTLSDEDNDGVIGISNIGNTCYMNSALQCIMHSKFVKDFIMSSDLTNNININNPLGTKGDLLISFADLMKEYWRTRNSRIHPSNFKRTLGNYLATFDGFSQHDSQEFLSQLLDALHEDVNRVLRKPYTQTIESKSHDDDKTAARMSWINFLKRNYSIFIENLYGQFKSTVNCPTCPNMSITFDPYQIVSLGIPSIASKRFMFYYINADNIKSPFKVEFYAKSIHNFNDISLSHIIDVYAEKFSWNREKLRFAVLGYDKPGLIMKNDATLASVDEQSHNGNYLDKIFLLELNDVDLVCCNDPQSINVHLRTNYEIFDNLTVSRNSYEWYKLTRDYEEDPIHIQTFYATRKYTVRDLYVSVLRKFYSCTNFDDGEITDHSYFEGLWTSLETKMNEKIFFYLTIGSVKLEENTFDKPLNDFVGEDQNMFFVNVFLRTPNNASVKVDLKRLKHCEFDRSADLTFESNDLNSFNNEYSIEDLLRSFSKPEILGTDNMWYCSSCQMHVQATKTMQIYKSPRVLVLHLKKLKLNTKSVPLITFPVDEFDISPFVLNNEPTQAYGVVPEEFLCEQDLISYVEKKQDVLLTDNIASDKLNYRLYGVVNHYGSQNFGHYTSFCVDKAGQWWEFNDASTNRVSKEKVVSEGAYLLFYEKVDSN